jgi:opacity protein-like surface antigen
MKTLRTLTAASALLAAAGAANAADVYSSSKDPVPSISGAPSFWVAGGVGLGSGKSTASVPGFSLDLSQTGAIFDVRAGVDRSMAMIAPNLTLGLYGEIGNSRDVSGTLVGQLWSYGAGVRVGYQMGNLTPYGLVGYTRQDVSFDGLTQSLGGIKLGAGVRYTLPNNWFGELEGDWTGFEKTNVVFVNVDNSATQVMFRVGKSF